MLAIVRKIRRFRTAYGVHPDESASRNDGGCAEELNLAAPVNVGPLAFSIAQHGWGMYLYCADHPSAESGPLRATTSLL